MSRSTLPHRFNRLATRTWYRWTMIGPVTLGDLACHCKQLRVVCPDCGHAWDYPLASVRLPPATPLPRVGKLMMCGACGSRNMQAKPPLILVVSR